MRRFVIFLTGLLLLILAVGLFALPAVFQRGYAAGGMRPALYGLTLLTLALFIGVLLALIYQRFVRTMIILLILARIINVAWEYLLDLHSLWYLVVSIVIHVLVAALAIYLINVLEKHRTPGV